jgi:hypothetical protein
MSYKPMVLVQGSWAGNAVRFESKEEAEASAKDLFGRWLLVEDYRADESEDPVNYRWDLSKCYPEAMSPVEKVAIGPVNV